MKRICYSLVFITAVFSLASKAQHVSFIPVSPQQVLQSQAQPAYALQFYRVQQLAGEQLQYADKLYIPLAGKSHAASIVQKFEHANGDLGVIARLQQHNKEHLVIATFGKAGSLIDVVGPDVRLNMQLHGQQLQVLDLLQPGINPGVFANDGIYSPGHKSKQQEFSFMAQGAASAAEPAIVDVMLLYTEQIQRRFPGDMAVTLMNHLITNANQAFANSKANVQLRLVHTEQVQYRQPDNALALEHLFAAVHGQQSDNSLNHIRQLTLAKGADLVAMIRTHALLERGNCGIARFPAGQNIAVNISNYGVHGGSDCTGTFTHEVGHNFGAQHQYLNGEPSGVTSYAGAYFKDGSFTTLMGSFGTGTPLRTRKLHHLFSSPQLKCAGISCGDANTADNVRIINEVAPQLQARQESKVTQPFTPLLPIPKDSDGDGVIDQDDAFPFDASEQKDTDNDGQGDNSDAFPNNPQEQLDTDNDGTGNNADTDDDNDGVVDSADAFPLDKNESSDQDADGFGDNRDQFDQDASEQFDADEDGIGNKADKDDDNDGVADYAAGDDVTQMELWVTDAKQHKIWRIDAANGSLLSAAVSPGQGAISFRSQMLAHDDNQLFYLAFSDVYVFDRQQNSNRLLIPRSALADNFSGHILQDNSGRLLVKSGFGSAVLQQFNANTSQLLTRQLLQGSVVQDMQQAEDSSFWAVVRNQNLVLKQSMQPFSELQRRSSAHLNKPEQMAFTSDGKLLLSNYQSGVLLKELAPFVDTGIEQISCLYTVFKRIYVCDRYKGQIQVRDENSGDLVTVIDSLPAGSEPMSLQMMPKALDLEPFNKANDSDNDGVPNFEDTLPFDPSDTVDTDADGQVNNVDTDDDNDGMPDVFEIQYGLKALVDDSAEDADSDGVTNLAEFQAGTNPIKADAPTPPPPPPAPPTPPATGGGSGGGSIGIFLPLLLLLWVRRVLSPLTKNHLLQ